MGFYAGSLYLGGGILIFRNNVVLFWLVAFAALISAFFGFRSSQRYIAISVLVLCLLAFNVVMPSFVHAFRLLRKK